MVQAIGKACHTTIMSWELCGSCPYDVRLLFPDFLPVDSPRKTCQKNITKKW